MPTELPVPMPKMSMTMETGEMLLWSVPEGASIQAGDVIAEVQTDKVDMEVESPFDGVLARIVAQPGDTIDVGAPIAFILTESEDLMAGLFDPPPDVASEPTTPNSDVPPELSDHNKKPHRGPKAATPVSRRGPRPAVPLARRRAAELHVSLDTVIPTGPEGVITVADVEQAAASNAAPSNPAVTPPATATAPPRIPTEPAVVRKPTPAATPLAQAPAADPSTTDPGFADALAPRRRAIRSAIARTMTASTSIPQFTVFAELNLEPVNLVRNKIGWTTLLVRGLARAIRKYPHVNAGWDAAANAPATPHENVGIALAIDSAVGLLAPVIRDPDLLSVQDLDALVRATVNRARTGKLAGADIQGATTTLSNLGGFGVPSFTSLLTPPQATALSVGAISPRPVVIGAGLTVRLSTTVGLTIDHRPVDGADGARLLADLQDLFNHPDKLLS